MHEGKEMSLKTGKVSSLCLRKTPWMLENCLILRYYLFLIWLRQPSPYKFFYEMITDQYDPKSEKRSHDIDSQQKCKDYLYKLYKNKAEKFRQSNETHTQEITACLLLLLCSNFHILLLFLIFNILDFRLPSCPFGKNIYTCICELLI